MCRKKAITECMRAIIVEKTALKRTPPIEVFGAKH
jgi:hypothetical protein